MKKLFLALICAAVGLSASPPAFADASDPVLIGTYSGWKAYHFQDKAGQVCFMSRQPEKQQGNFKKRGEVFFFVTHWSGEKDKNVVSVSNGYGFKQKSLATLSFKGKKFNLFTQGEMAWTKDQAEDVAVIKELQSGSSMSIKGTSSRGTETADTYNLKGSAEAYKAIIKQCAAEKAPHPAPAAYKEKN